MAGVLLFAQPEGAAAVGDPKPTNSVQGKVPLDPDRITEVLKKNLCQETGAKMRAGVVYCEESARECYRYPLGIQWQLPIFRWPCQESALTWVRSVPSGPETQVTVNVRLTRDDEPEQESYNHWFKPEAAIKHVFDLLNAEATRTPSPRPTLAGSPRDSR